MAKTVVGLMENMPQAQEVVRDLESSGFDRNSINLIGSQKGAGTTDTEGVRGLREEHKNATAEGAATGAGAGAAVGGLAGFVAGLTAITIPGIGPAVALGPLGAAIAGAGIGAVAGGGIGALMKMGVPERDAQFYMEGVRRGGVLVAISCPEDRTDDAATILQRHGAIDIDKRGDQWKKEGWTGFHADERRDEEIRRPGSERFQEREDITTDRPRAGMTRRDESFKEHAGEYQGRDVGLSERAAEEISPRLRQDMAEERQEGIRTHSRSDRPEGSPEWTDSDPDRRIKDRRSMESRSREGGERVIPVTEENVQVGKREVPENMVRVYSHTESVPIQENVSLREERADIQRRGVDRPVSDADRDAFKETSVEIPEMREEPVVSKEARVKEEVLVGKEFNERNETISDTARRTRVDVDRSGGQEHPMAATGLNAEDEDFRRHYQNLYGGRGDFEAYRSAYHYADEDSEARRYQGRDWSEVEEDLHRSWDRSHGGTWNEFKEAIRYGWNKKRHI